MKVKKLIAFIKDEDGLELSEYAVMGSLIVVALVGIIGTLGTTIGESFTALTTNIDPTP